jgi:hypothetical protein
VGDENLAIYRRFTVVVCWLRKGVCFALTDDEKTLAGQRWNDFGDSL